MAGVHDVGGQPGYGAPKVPKSKSAAATVVFAARWEAAVFAMMGTIGARGVFKNSDQFRHAVERVDPAAYFAHGYYGRWLGALETLLIEASELSKKALDDRVGELAAGLGATAEQVAKLVAPENVASRVSATPDVVPASPNRISSVRYLSAPPRFAPGDRVRTVPYTNVGATAAPRHTRLPQYATGCSGVVVACHNGWVLPDSNAHGEGEQPSHLYTVAFSGEALYGAGAEPGISVRLDLFEPYLAAQA